jgi:hypothetical protein
MDVELKECKNNNHDFIDIYDVENSYGECIVIRWCRVCGSIIIDVDFDYRTYVGRCMEIKNPIIYKNYKNNNKEENIDNYESDFPISPKDYD